MAHITAFEILQSFEGAKNINAAFKKFLKNDAGKDQNNLKFIKGLKQIFASRDEGQKLAFLNKHLPDFEPHFLVIGRYAYLEPVDAVTEEVITKFAEEFNTTYSKHDNGIEILNERFSQIVSEVMAIISQRYEDGQLPKSKFMTSIILNSIFDAEVLKEVVVLIPQD